MWPLQFMGYTFDPTVAAEIATDMWTNEPIGTVSILISMTGLMLTLAYKLLDLWWDMRKEKARQGRLKIELLTDARDGRPCLKAVVSNLGREPVVLRDFGYYRTRLLRAEFMPVRLDGVSLPCTLGGQELAEFHLAANQAFLLEARNRFGIRDSRGRIWEAEPAEIKRARRQLDWLARQMAITTPSPQGTA